jgi:hypothetical protein
MIRILCRKAREMNRGVVLLLKKAWQAYKQSGQP